MYYEEKIIGGVLMWRGAPDGAWLEVSSEEMTSRITTLNNSNQRQRDGIKAMLDALTDDERSDLFNEYCSSCGSKDPECQCWNDE
jgi:hypothetical protein